MRSIKIKNGIKTIGKLNFRYLSTYDSFYKVNRQDNKPYEPPSLTVKGEIIDHAVDMRNVRPGETIEIPYEVTISHSLRDFWQSAFYSHDRINTSTPFARSLGLQDQVVPFNLMLFLAGSMSHADLAKLQVGYSNAIYHWPAFAGDTFKKQFKILSLRSTSGNRNSVFTINCKLINQRNLMVFSCEKTMLFPFVVAPSEVEIAVEKEQKNEFLEHLILQAQTLQSIGSQTLTSLRAGQLILHTLTRPLTLTQTMQLANLARLTHEKHFNTKKFRREELLVPGGLVFLLLFIFLYFQNQIYIFF
jgi:hypothetical protein